MIRLLFIIISCLGILVACGYKGALYLPKTTANNQSVAAPAKIESVPVIPESTTNIKNKES